MANATKSKLAAAKAALNRKQADLDAIDDQIMGLDSGIPMDAPATPEFDLLTAKREELEEEIRTMREGVQFISEWEKLKGGQWSEGIRSQLDGLDSEIANIAGGDAAEPGMGVGPDLGAPMGDPLAAPPAPDALAAPAGEVAPEAAPALDAAPDAVAPAPEAPAPALEPPLASAKSAVNKKNNYQTSQKRGNSAPQMKKEGSNMANPTATKPSNLKEKLAELKTKRETIKKEAQVRTAAAYTIANTMLPSAPVEKRQAFASSLLQGNDTKALVAALRQTAINAHYSKVAEQFKEVHKVELNDLLEDPSVLKSERSAVEKEIKGDAKSATSKKADDRKDAGPQEGTYEDGRKGSEPKEMEASKAGDRPDAGEKPGQTVNLSDGKSAAAKKACKDGEKCAGCENCKKAAEKKCDKCKGECKCASKTVAAKSKKADEPPMDAPMDAPAGDAPAMDAPAADLGAEVDAPMDAPMEGDAPVDDAGAILTDEKKMVVQEEIDTVKDAVRALETELLEENEEEIPLALEEGEGEPSEEELDLSSVFDQGEMEDKAASLANEGEEHTAGDDGDFFAPTSAAGMESVLDDSGMQVASIESYFDMQGSDADPLYSLIASETKEAAAVAGFDVLESFTGEVANKMKQDGSEGRDNEVDHDEDLFVEAMKDIKPEEQGAKRTPQDARPELQAPKSAAAKTAAKVPTGSIKRVRPVVASPKAVDIATALFGNDE
jgi:hypothetical protein